MYMIMILIYLVSLIISLMFFNWSYKEINFVKMGSKRQIAEENYIMGAMTMIPVANSFLAATIIICKLLELRK